MIMYILINLNYDGDSYQIFPNIEDAKKSFDESIDNDYYHAVFLVKAEPGVEFGFGARGEIYGADVIEEFYDE